MERAGGGVRCLECADSLLTAAVVYEVSFLLGRLISACRSDFVAYSRSYK